MILKTHKAGQYLSIRVKMKAKIVDSSTSVWAQALRIVSKTLSYWGHIPRSLVFEYALILFYTDYFTLCWNHF
jgi:hypothetical protein